MKGFFHIPRLSWWQRIILYLVTFCVIGLTILQLMYEFAAEGFSYVLYISSAMLLCASMYYLIMDIICIRKYVIKTFIEKYGFTRRLISDYRYRTVCFTYLSFMVNLGFALMNGIYGVLNQSWWFLTFAIYYALLSIMRAKMLRTERKNALLGETGQMKRNEWGTYRTGGIMFLFLTITLVGTVALITSNYGSKSYSGTVIFAVAAYTFYKITIAVIHLFKVRKLNSPLIAMIRYIGYADALASMVLLQTAMFSSFSEENLAFETRMNTITGIFACSMMFGIGIFMIWNGSKHEKIVN